MVRMWRCFFICLLAIILLVPVIPIAAAPGDLVTVEVQISSGNDDCVFFWNGSSWDADGLGYAGLYTGYVDSHDCREGVALRWARVPVPPGAVVSNCYISLCASSSQSGVTVNSKISGNKELNAASWDDLADYQLRRGILVGGPDNSRLTDAQVSWRNVSAWSGNEWYNSPDISSVIQEIIDQSGWESGNPIALFWDDHDNLSTQANDTYRGAYSYDSSHTNAAKLHIEYTEPDVSEASAPVVTTQPANRSVRAGSTASFYAEASGNPEPSVQWSVSTDQGANFTAISAATSTTLRFTAALTDSGNQYRAVFTNSEGSATTNTVTLTVKKASSSSGGGHIGGGSGSSKTSVDLLGFSKPASLVLYSSGKATRETQLKSVDGGLLLAISKNTILKDAKGKVLKSLSAGTLAAETLSAGSRVILKAYELSPDATLIKPSVTLGFYYDIESLPVGAIIDSLTLAFWDGTNWNSVASVIDKEAGFIQAQISHFSRWALLVDMLPPAVFTLSDLEFSCTQIYPGEHLKIQAVVYNTGGLSGEYTAALKLNTETLDNRTLTVEPGSSSLLTFDITPDTPGNYLIDLNGKQGSFMVVEPVLNPTVPTPSAIPLTTNSISPMPTSDSSPAAVALPSSVSQPATPENHPSHPFPALVIWVLLPTVIVVLILVLALFFIRHQKLRRKKLS